MALKTDYKDYIPPSGGRKYKITANSDGSSSVEDITQYQQVGDTWGAEDINQANKLVNGAVYPNLLDNSDFTNPVNQRGAGSYSGTGIYCIDRWKLWGGYNVDSHTLTFQSSNAISVAGLSACLLMQRVAGIAVGDTVTLSASVNGTAYIKNVTITGSETAYNMGSFYFICGYNSDSAFFEIAITSDSISVEWTKVEKGSVATPYVPKGYGTELVECYRYFWISSMQVNIFKTTAGDYFRNTVYFPIAMRTVPSVTILASNGTVSINNVTIDAVKFAGNGGNDTVTSFSASADL